MKKRFKVFHHIDQQTIDSMHESYSPVFVLSTGRSGSKYIHNILSQSESLVSYHEASPTLMYFSDFAYHNQHQPELLKAMILATRLELLLSAYNAYKTFIESNQCMVFFAPAIREVFQNARFVHLVRHPGHFVRSAIMKGWHANDSVWESGRVKMQDTSSWSRLNHIEKLAWVWSATNSFIIEFCRNLPIWQYKIVRMEDLVSDREVMMDILRFIDCNDDQDLDAMMQAHSQKVNELEIHDDEPPNMKKINTYPAYHEWTVNDKKCLRKITSKLADDFGYKI